MRRPHSSGLRELRFSHNLVYVTLTQGLFAVIDAADAYLISEHGWHTRKNRAGLVYAVTNTFTDALGYRRPMQMHRLVMGVEGTKLVVDHIDGNGLNNRRANLRVATRMQNCHNQRIRRNNTSGFKGVHWNGRDRRWVAQIMVAGQKYALGNFTDLEEAGRAYRDAAAILQGKFAWGTENGVVFSDPTMPQEEDAEIAGSSPFAGDASGDEVRAATARSAPAVTGGPASRAPEEVDG